MGVDPLAVVGADLALRGMASLRVVDASIMPTIVSANTNAAALIIAEKASDLILSDHRNPQRASHTVRPAPGASLRSERGLGGQAA